MICKLKLLALPVRDTDGSIAFYVDQLSWHVDHDHTVSDEIRFVQVTPPDLGVLDLERQATQPGRSKVRYVHSRWLSPISRRSRSN